MAAETDSPVRHMLFMDVVVKATYDHFKKWWAQYEADISSTPMTSTRGVAFDAWLAAIKLVEEKFTANNTQMENICPKSAVLRSNHTLVCIEDGDSCTGIVGACQDNERVYL